MLLPSNGSKLGSVGGMNVWLRNEGMERFYSYRCLGEERALVLDTNFCSRVYLVHDIHEPNQNLAMPNLGKAQ